MVTHNSRKFLLTIVVPVFNEHQSIRQLLTRVWEVDLPKQIIVVDDGSTDGSQDIIREFLSDRDIVFIVHEVNRGKGASIRTALNHARGDLLIVQDGDLEYDPNDYPKLVAPILNGEADVVYGSRRLGQRTPWRRLMTPFYHGVSMLNFLVWFFYGLRVTDEATCYKVFRTEDLRQMELECERFEYCPEVTGKASRLGLRIKEIPIQYSARKVSDGKKIRFKDAVEAAVTLWKHRKWRPQDTYSKEKDSLHSRKIS